MNEITLTVDGRQVTVAPDATVLQACEELGIRIPTLCYHKALPGYGACRLCLVEAELGGRARLQASCTLRVSEGLVVRTDTERVTNTRRVMAELLLARCPDADRVREVAAEVGVTDTRFEKKNEDCILCGLCTRICSSLMGSGAIDFGGRGDTRRVGPAYDKHSKICMACGACEQVCPTNAVHLEEVSPRPIRRVTSIYDAGLSRRPSIYIPYQQAIPKVPVIDRSTCMHFLKEGEMDACKACETACPAHAIDYDQQDEVVEIDVGAAILAPGFCVFDAAQKLEFGYAWSPNVLTSLQFERLQSASGPFEGQILRMSDGEHPHHIGFIQCVGSRDFEHNYCSSVCCMYATKEAIIAKEHDPDLECTIFYMDLRAFGKGFDAYFERAKELGVRFVRCRPSHVEEVEETGNLIIHYEAEDGRLLAEEFDMVVLSVGLRPPEGAGELAGMFGIALDENGFASTSPTGSVKTLREGVYVCGPFAEPKDIPETVVEAGAAAATAMSLLSEGRGTQIVEREYPPEKDVAGQPPRIGVFVCHCGKNIGGVVDVPSVAEYARTLPDVVYAEDNLYTCSSDTQAQIRQLIDEHDLNRVIVASCTPRTHEPLFRSTVREACLNPYLFEMANIRDQCSWIHMHQPIEATAKAKDLIRAAVAKARLLEPLQMSSVPVTSSALVVGGGAAGMTAALSLAKQGFPVHLVERREELGGNLRKVRYLIRGDDPRRILDDMVQAVTEDPQITVWTDTRIESIDGYVGNFATTLRRGGESTKVEHGVVIVATGGEESVPTEYGYGTDDRILTQLSLEQRLADGAFDAKTVVMIQCVGSREGDRMYCSRVCCSQAVKNALRIKEQRPDADIYILYRELRTYGFNEAYYTEARERGIKFIRYDLDARPTVSIADEALTVEVLDPALTQRLQIHPDLVVLAPAIVPQDDVEELGQMLSVPFTKDRFFLEAHMKLRPVDFATEGVFLAGLAHSAKSLTESMAQGEAAAARAATIISKERYPVEATIASVDEYACSGCGLCVSVCEYGALEVVLKPDGRRVAEVTEVLCKGCGSCAATCPSGAMEQKGFKSEQVLDAVEAAIS